MTVRLYVVCVLSMIFALLLEFLTTARLTLVPVPW